MAGREQDVRDMGLHMLHGRAIALLQHQRQIFQQIAIGLVFNSQIGSKHFPDKR